MSTSFDRTTEVRGAGTVSRNSVQFFDQSSIEVTPNVEFNDLMVAGYGKIDETIADALIEVAFNPVGFITAAILAELYPAAYLTPVIDASIFGATDVPADIHSMLGKKLTLHNTAITKMPSLKLGAQEDVFQGGAQITGLIKNSTARSAADSVFTLADAAWAGTITRANHKRLSYTGTWNSLTIVAQESWQVDFDLSLNPRKTDDIGTYDMGMGGLVVRARCRPVSLAETILNYRNLQANANAAIGASPRLTQDLTIVSDAVGGITVVLKDAIMKEGPCRWGENELRAGEIGFEASRDLTGALPGAIASVGVTEDEEE